MARDTALCLFSQGTELATPWEQAGYNVVHVDIANEVTWSGKTVWLKANLQKPGLKVSQFCDPARIAVAFAHPPCDHIAISGARWFQGKGLRLLADSIHMFATAAELCEETGAPYLIENPVSVISSHWRKPDYVFQPYEYTGYDAPQDNYRKRTCLWTGGGFIMPEERRIQGLGKPDERVHRAQPGPDRWALRSALPIGFARAVFEANALQSMY